MKNTRNRIAVLVLLAVYLCSMLAFPAGAEDYSTADVIKAAKPAVMKLFVMGLDDEGKLMYYPDLATNSIAPCAFVGSGFGVGKSGSAPEYIVTNWHVAHAYMEQFNYQFDTDHVRIWVMLEGFTISDVTGFPSDATAIECSIVRTVESGYPDYAILKASRPLKEYSTLPIASASTVEQGDTVIALGCPGLVDNVSFDKYGSEITTTVGTVSKHMKFTERGNTDVIVHSADIAGGNSGGPLVNMKGQVVGLNTYGLTNSSSNTYSIAVYSDYVTDALDLEGIAYETDPLIGGEKSAPAPKFDMKVLAVGAAVVVAAAALIFYTQKKKPAAPVTQPANNVAEQKVAHTSAAKAGGFQVKMPDGKIVTINKTKVLVGRGSECAVRFPEDNTLVSHRHCSLEDCGEYLVLADEGSRNGTFVHGKQIPDGKKVALKHGSSFTVGSENNRITVL